MDHLAALWIYTPWEFALALAIVMAGGLVRGFTGFGNGLVMMPLLTLLWGPVEALGLIVALGAAAALQLFPRAAPLTDWPNVAPIIVGTTLLTPLGTAVLVSLDPHIIKKLVAAFVLLATLVTLRGWVYRGPRGLVPGFAAGGLTGFVNGVAGVGGPAIVLYLMSLPAEANVHRANIVAALTVSTITAFTAMAVAGAISHRVLVHTVVFLAPMLASVWLGARLFHILPARLFKLIVLWFLIAISAMILVA